MFSQYRSTDPKLTAGRRTDSTNLINIRRGMDRICFQVDSMPVWITLQKEDAHSDRAAVA